MERDAIEIIPFQRAWKAQFDAAKNDLEHALGDTALCIEHIGSTSIQNMPSKDRIDIQIGINEISAESCERINTKLKVLDLPTAYLSADHLPPTETDEQQWKKIYLRGQTSRWRFKANIHIRQVGAKNYHYALLFRDYLRSDYEAAIAYARLKQTLARYTRFDRDAYCEIKDPACDLIMINAKTWEKANR